MATKTAFLMQAHMPITMNDPTGNISWEIPSKLAAQSLSLCNGPLCERGCAKPCGAAGLFIPCWASNVHMRPLHLRSAPLTQRRARCHAVPHTLRITPSSGIAHYNNFHTAVHTLSGYTISGVELHDMSIVTPDPGIPSSPSVQGI